jgi:hypothetical protein
MTEVDEAGRFWCGDLERDFIKPLISLVARQDPNLQPDRYERRDNAQLH